MLDKKDLKDIKGVVKDVVDDGFDNFAVIVKDGFDEVDKKFEQATEERKALRQGQENIELKLSNVAYRFEIEEIIRRLKILETKAGLK